MKNFIIILDGPMGAGKTTIGSLLEKKLKRTATINMDRIKWFISDFRRSKKDNAIVSEVVLKMSEAFLKQNINLVVPQGFTKERISMQPYIQLAKKYKAEIFIYHLDAPKHILLKRINTRKTGKQIKYPVAKSRIHRNIRLWKSEQASVGEHIETDKLSKTKIVNQILKPINQKWKRKSS